MKELIQKAINKLAGNNIFDYIPSVNADAPMIKILQDDERIDDLEKYLEAPRRIDQHVKLSTLASFVAYVNHFAPRGVADKFGRASIFIKKNVEEIHVSCVLDYHSDSSTPSHATHLAELDCQKNESFLFWMKNDNTWFDQAEMVQALKRHSDQIEAENFAELIQKIEEINTDTNQSSNVSAGKNQKSKTVYFNTIQNFSFRLKPIESLPYKYSAAADLYCNIDSDGDVRLKYVIRNRNGIFNGIIEDLHESLAIDDVLVF